MNDLESRLRDAFDALDAAVSVPARAPAHRRPSTRTLALVAAVATVVAASVVTITALRRHDGVTIATRPVDAETFDARVAPACAQALSERRRQQPRFATREAYRTVAAERLTVIRTFRSALQAQVPPADDPGLIVEVVSLLDVAEARAADLISSAHTADVAALDDAWPEIDERLDDALRRLGDHGAKECLP